MKLFIANCTKQDHVFNYRIPEERGLKMQSIQMGSQSQIGGDLNQPQIDAIIEQHAHYGLVSVAEFERSKKFVPYLYSVGTPVKADSIRRAMEINSGVLIFTGKKMREEAAIATNNTIENNMREQGLSPNLNELEMTVIEEEQGGFTDSEPMAEGVRVTRGSDNHEGTTRSRGRPRKAS